MKKKLNVFSYQKQPDNLQSWILFLVDKKIKIEKEDGEGPEGDVDNPDEIEIGSSDEDEDKKPKKKEEEVEPEDEEEDVDNWEAYDPKHDPNLEDFDPGEIQEHRYGNRSDTYWLISYESFQNSTFLLLILPIFVALFRHYNV